MKYRIKAQMNGFKIEGKKEILNVLKKIDKKVVEWRNTKRKNGSR